MGVLEGIARNLRKVFKIVSIPLDRLNTERHNFIASFHKLERLAQRTPYGVAFDVNGSHTNCPVYFLRESD